MRCLFLLSLVFMGASGLNWHSMYAGDVPDGTGKDAKPVFYAIIMGKLAFRHQVSLWLSSLRKLGGFKDEVVMVTDKPTCLAKTLSEAKLLGKMISSTAEVDIYGPAEGYVGNVHLIKRPSQKRTYMMKMEKTHAWLNVKNAAIPHPVSSIIYTDEDVVIGKDLTNFVAMVRESEKKKHTLGLFRDTGTSVGELHTGVVVIYPGEATEQCLATWGHGLARIGRQEVAKGMKHAFKEKESDGTDLKEGEMTEAEMEFYGPDQRALGATKQCKSTKKIHADHDGLNIFPAEYFWFPTKGGLEQEKTAEFVHFTNTGRWKIISHEAIKKYLTKIGIPAEIDPMGNLLKADQCAEADNIQEPPPAPKA